MKGNMSSGKDNWFRDWSNAIKSIDLTNTKGMSLKWRKIKKDTVVTGAALCITEAKVPVEWNNFTGPSMIANGYTHYILIKDILNLPME